MVTSLSERFSLSELKDLMESLGVSPKRSLGQNFLVNKITVQKIIDSLKVDQSDRLIEVGPGLGALTNFLGEIGKELVVLELDRKFSEYWRERGVSVVEGDALRANWKDVTQGQQSILVSNLPYQISSSLVIDRSVDPCGVFQMVLMFQKEVAQRITADHGSKDYGLLTVIAQTFWETKLLLEAGPKDFYPPPKVASRVLTFDLRESPVGDSLESRKNYLKFVKSAFSQRRKVVWKNWRGYFSERMQTLDGLKKYAESKGVSESARAEQLSIEQYIDFFNWIGQWESK